MNRRRLRKIQPKAGHVAAAIDFARPTEPQVVSAEPVGGGTAVRYRFDCGRAVTVLLEDAARLQDGRTLSERLHAIACRRLAEMRRVQEIQADTELPHAPPLCTSKRE